EYREVLTGGEPLLVTGTVDAPFGDGEMVRERLRFFDAKPLASVRAQKSSLVDIRLDVNRVSEDALTALDRLLRQYPGACRTRLRLEIPTRSETILDLPDHYKVAASDDLLIKLEQLFGRQVAVLR